MDKIIINELAVSFHVGVPDAERANPQRLLLTVEMDYDFAGAAAGDDLTKTIDYHAVSQRLLHFGDARSWKLIETLAVEIAAIVLKEFKAKNVRVEVRKFIIPEARYVAVEVVRKRWK